MFPLGHIWATPNVLREVPHDELHSAMHRHGSCDWGELAEDDICLNDWSVENGGRLFSAYVSRDGVKFWIITEADRSCTTILLPDEY